MNKAAIRIERGCVAPAGWDELVAADPMADYSHTAHWTQTAATGLPGASALWLSVHASGRLVAGLAAVERHARFGPLDRGRLESSLEGTSGGPLVAADLTVVEQDECFVRLVGAFAKLRSGPLGASTFALGPARERRFAGLLAGDGKWRRRASPTSVICLDGGLETVERERLSMAKRNERNRGLRRGATVDASRSADDLVGFHSLYTAASVHWGIVPAPLPYLQALLADPHGCVFFTCVRLDGRVIGGHLNLHWGDRVFAWIGVTDPACARSHFPATLCYWGDLVEACRRGARWLDLGASGGRESLDSFKKYFGAESQERGYYVNEGAAPRLARAGRAVVSRLTGSRGGGRWHDGRTGPRRRGGPA